nr:hypothetical protein [Tanacetum cinerariifolium]
EFDSVCDDLHLNTRSIFKADHVNAFDLDCDEVPTASSILFARLSPAVSNNESYDELTSDSNVISYADYMTTIQNDVAQSVPPPEQDNAMILYVIEQMQSQVERCNTEEQQDILADGLEEFDSVCDDLHLNTRSIFKVDHVDAFYSDCDEVPTASSILFARLSPAGTFNGDDVSPTYDSNILC